MRKERKRIIRDKNKTLIVCEEAISLNEINCRLNTTEKKAVKAKRCKLHQKNCYVGAGEMLSGYYSCRGSKFSSQYLHAASQPPVRVEISGCVT